VFETTLIKIIRIFLQRTRFKDGMGGGEVTRSMDVIVIMDGLAVKPNRGTMACIINVLEGGDFGWKTKK
jgi:hypothetical protein